MQRQQKQYRDIYVVAVNGDKESSIIKLRQTVGSESAPERLVLRVDEGKPRQDGTEQKNIRNGDYGIFGGHRVDWVEDKLTGFRKKVGDVVCIQARVLPSEVPTEKDMEGLEAF